MSDDYASPDRPGYVAACPECDTASVYRRDDRQPTYRCGGCHATFSEYVERIKKTGHGIRGDCLAARLEQASPDDVSREVANE